ncbi:hypothetical protein [Haloferax profundi]|uniref:Uncharacterized protein n=1 Tax=Haloferax profundi TaxID=1544718 RepID=A0A0W1SGI3_9EURY|nr:hypothetical protein [Haloferax profundi]KTG25156.1 hypothetical protein AUR66_16465 [Haloferax profundi]
MSGVSALAVMGLAGCISGQSTSTTNVAQHIATHEQAFSQVPDHSEAGMTADVGFPAFVDEYLGFSIGKPDGWHIEYDGGIIAVKPVADDDTTVAFAYPIALPSDGTPDQAVAAFVSDLASGFEARGGQLTSSESQLTGSLDGVALTGELQAHTDGPQYVLSGGWAPDTDWGALREAILSIGASYMRRPGRPLVRALYEGTDATGGRTTWEYVVPEGWLLGDASSRGIDIYGNYDAEIEAYNAHVGFGYPPFGLGNHTPASFVDEYVGAIQQYSSFRILSWGQSRALGTETDATGTTWELHSFDYEATYGIEPMHGVMTAAVANYSIGYPQPRPYHSGMIWMREITLPEWDALAAITAVVQSYIRVVASQPGQGILSPVTNAPDYGADIMDVYQQRSASMDYLGREWEEAILSYETCTQESTGEVVYMPYSSYYPGGVDGGPAGYYIVRSDGSYEHTPVV